MIIGVSAGSIGLLAIIIITVACLIYYCLKRKCHTNPPTSNYTANSVNLTGVTNTQRETDSLAEGNTEGASKYTVLLWQLASLSKPHITLTQNLSVCLWK